MTAGSKQNAARSSVVQPVPQGEQPVDPVEGLGLGVGAVELDVAEGPVGQGRAAPRGAAIHSACRPRIGQRAETRSARAMALVARCSWRWTRPRPGNDHSGTTMGWPSAS